MMREMLRAKVHRITVTECDVEYEGSLTLDAGLMKLAGMVPFERIDVYDVDNGSRFSTYLIEGPEGSGVCCINGAAARMTGPGHKVIIAAYCSIPEAEVRDHKPKIVLVDARNRVTVTKDYEGAGVRVNAS
ncbi:MAG TPA: aspartate 1-decarboxylase [Candidatus Polarisedimenticolaceae bacterium]